MFSFVVFLAPLFLGKSGEWMVVKKKESGWACVHLSTLSNRPNPSPILGVLTTVQYLCLSLLGIFLAGLAYKMNRKGQAAQQTSRTSLPWSSKPTHAMLTKGHYILLSFFLVTGVYLCLWMHTPGTVWCVTEFGQKDNTNHTTFRTCPTVLMNSLSSSTYRNEKSGLYKYFKDNPQHPIQGFSSSLSFPLPLSFPQGSPVSGSFHKNPPTLTQLLPT